MEAKTPRGTTIIKGIEYDLCPCCGKPKRGTGRSAGAVAAFVVKSYVRSGKIVDFPLQWKTLCESVGFETIEEIHAHLVEHRGTQHTLEGGTVEKNVKRSSFFRRLYEAKHPENAIDWETVYLMRKPLTHWRKYDTI